MIDTMYKDRNKTALVKNNELVREIVGPDSDYVELLKISLNCAKNRVVLKQLDMPNQLKRSENAHTRF